MKSVSSKPMNVIGLISGTSVDGIDTVLVEMTGGTDDLGIQVLAGQTYDYPADLREQIQAACQNQAFTLEALSALDDQIATQFALAARQIQKEGHATAALVGSHGQTVYHRPPRPVSAESAPYLIEAQNSTNQKGTRLPANDPPQPDASASVLGYSLQLGRGVVIAELTQLPTVSNFRAADIAVGGQGAPLVSKVDAYLLSATTHHRCVQNLGGIANLTYLPPRNSTAWDLGIVGWDTGPANTLIDLAVSQLTQGQQAYDDDGRWAAQGEPCQALVDRWLTQAYFQQAPPKSTGRELFGATYLANCWQDYQDWQQHQGQAFQAADWLATLTELTARSIVDSYRAFLPQLPDEVLLCGGGSRNNYLRQRLQRHLGPQTTLSTTDAVGLDGAFKEAIAFAVLAYWRYCWEFPGNLPQVTGASQPALLGDIALPYTSS